MKKNIKSLDLSGRVAPFPRKKFETYISYLKVQSKDFGRIPFNLLGSQQYLLDEIEAGLKDGVTVFVVLKSRQVGSTTLFFAIDMFYASEYGGLQGAFLIHEEKALDKLRAIIDVFIETMPVKVRINGKWQKFRPEKVRHSRNLLWFANDSMFTYLIAGTQDRTSAGIGRSGASNFVHGTEVAFYGNPDDIKEFKSAVSSLYAHRLQIWESTANSYNHFFDTCETAKRSPTMRFIFVGWWRNELFQFSTDNQHFALYTPDNRLTKLERQRCKAVKEAYDFDISLQQIAWYRWKLEDEFDGDQQSMDQEFPWTPDDAFQATGSKYFDGSVLTDCMRVAAKDSRIVEGYRYKIGRRWDTIDVVGWADPRADLWIWEHASQFGYYVVACDPAYGSSDEADHNAITVWRCYAECMVQVAEFCSPVFSTHQTAWVLAHLAGFYGACDSRVILEINGPGKAVFSELKNVQDYLREMSPKDDVHGLRNVLQHMRHYYYSRPDTMAGELAYHWITTEDRRRQMFAGLKSALELGRIIPRSLRMLQQMRRMVNDEGSVIVGTGNNSDDKEGGGHDDLVVSAALAHECWQSWLWTKLRGEGMTRSRSQQIEMQGGQGAVDRLVLNYLRHSNIQVPNS